MLGAAARQLAAYGYEAMSVAAVAEEAGTTRQALYRRWPGKAELSLAAMAAVAEERAQPESADPFADLVAELRDFQRGVSQPGRLSLVGTMLQDSVEPDVRARYQARVIAPRRARLRTIFKRAQRLGRAVAVAVHGSWYTQPSPAIRHLAWPQRTEALVWRAVGGSLPAD